jgi:hypothetical protein
MSIFLNIEHFIATAVRASHTIRSLPFGMECSLYLCQDIFAKKSSFRQTARCRIQEEINLILMHAANPLFVRNGRESIPELPLIRNYEVLKMKCTDSEAEILNTYTSEVISLVECHLMACYAVWLLQEPSFRRNVAPSSSG